MQCKSLWIKASAKCINVNVNITLIWCNWGYHHKVSAWKCEHYYLTVSFPQAVQYGALPFKSENIHGNIIKPSSLVSQYTINDCKPSLVSLDVSVLNIINHNNPVLWAQPLIQSAAEAFLRYYLKFSLFECGSAIKAYCPQSIVIWQKVRIRTKGNYKHGGCAQPTVK